LTHFPVFNKASVVQQGFLFVFLETGSCFTSGRFIGKAFMGICKLIAPIVLVLSAGVPVHARARPEFPGIGEVQSAGRELTGEVHLDTALIGATGRQPGGWADAFCVVVTAEQIGLAMDTLKAQVLDGVPIKRQADSFIAKLQAAQNRLSPKNIAAVFDQLEEFIVRVDTLSKTGELTLDQGDLLINSIIGVVCRT
jgi:hypothetical protein